MKATEKQINEVLPTYKEKFGPCLFSVRQGRNTEINVTYGYEHGVTETTFTFKSHVWEQTTPKHVSDSTYEEWNTERKERIYDSMMGRS